MYIYFVGFNSPQKSFPRAFFSAILAFWVEKKCTKNSYVSSTFRCYEKNVRLPLRSWSRKIIKYCAKLFFQFIGILRIFCQYRFKTKKFKTENVPNYSKKPLEMAHQLSVDLIMKKILQNFPDSKFIHGQQRIFKKNLSDHSVPSVINLRRSRSLPGCRILPLCFPLWNTWRCSKR